MAQKGNYRSKRYEFNPLPKSSDYEAKVAIEIAKTGREEVKRRKKAGFSVFFVKDGHIIEQHPDKSEIKIGEASTEWITLTDSKRKFSVKK
jgi:hypothetical protein